MSETASHGPCLTESEYQERIVALHDDLPPAPTSEDRLRVARAELYLAIDHRLGLDFPPDRREALWHAHRAARRGIGCASIRALLGRIVRRPGHSDGRTLASRLARAYATVLSSVEVDRMLSATRAESGVKPPRS